MAALLVAAVRLWMALLQGVVTRSRPGPWTWVGIALGILGIGILVGPDAFRAGGSTSLLAAGVLVFGSIVGFTAYIWLLRVCSPSRVATYAFVYAFVNPVVAVALGSALAGEPFGVRTAAATGVIVAAVAITHSSPNAERSGPGRRARR